MTAGVTAAFVATAGLATAAGLAFRTRLCKRRQFLRFLFISNTINNILEFLFIYILRKIGLTHSGIQACNKGTAIVFESTICILGI